jgi:hypothetical protein
MAAFGRPPHHTEGSMLQICQCCLRGVPIRLEWSWKRFVHLFLDSVVHAFHVASIVHADRVIHGVRRNSRSLLEGIARQRKHWANQKSKTKMHGSYIDFGGISDPFRVRCHPKSEKYQYPARFWPKGSKQINVASICGWLLEPILL